MAENGRTHPASERHRGGPGRAWLAVRSLDPVGTRSPARPSPGRGPGLFPAPERPAAPRPTRDQSRRGGPPMAGPVRRLRPSPCRDEPGAGRHRSHRRCRHRLARGVSDGAAGPLRRGGPPAVHRAQLVSTAYEAGLVAPQETSGRASSSHHGIGAQRSGGDVEGADPAAVVEAVQVHERGPHDGVASHANTRGGPAAWAAPPVVLRRGSREEAWRTWGYRPHVFAAVPGGARRHPVAADGRGRAGGGAGR
ncbi:hypothetical protein SUDANB178_00148 [Streptomyces sp. enrichment culture]